MITVNLGKAKQTYTPEITSFNTSEENSFVYGFSKEKDSQPQVKQLTAEEKRAKEQLKRVLGRIQNKAEQGLEVKKKVTIAQTQESVEQINIGSPKENKESKNKEDHIIIRPSPGLSENLF